LQVTHREIGRQRHVDDRTHLHAAVARSKRWAQVIGKVFQDMRLAQSGCTQDGQSQLPPGGIVVKENLQLVEHQVSGRIVTEPIGQHVRHALICGQLRLLGGLAIQVGKWIHRMLHLG
jgi:hypothetical protein